MQVDQRVFLAANSSVKLCCACACTRDPHSQSVSGNVHPEPVNIWVCLQSPSHQTCSCARIAWMLFVSITSAETALALVWSIFCGQMVCSRLHCVPVTDSFDDLWISRLYWCDESSALSRPTWDTFAFCTAYPRLSFPPDTFAVVDNWQFCIKSGLTKYLQRLPAFLCPSGINYPDIQLFGACHSWVLSNILGAIF